MAENTNDEEREPIRVNTREEFDDALDELFETGRPIEAPSVEALEEWGVDLEDEGGGEPRVVCGRGRDRQPLATRRILRRRASPERMTLDTFRRVAAGAPAAGRRGVVRGRERGARWRPTSGGGMSGKEHPRGPRPGEILGPAVLGCGRQDYFGQGSRGWLRLHEKGGKRHDVPAHHQAAATLDAYVEAATIGLGTASAASKRRAAFRCGGVRVRGSRPRRAAPTSTPAAARPGCASRTDDLVDGDRSPPPGPVAAHLGRNGCSGAENPRRAELKGSPVGQVRRDPRRPERVAARRGRQPRGRGAPLDHRQNEPPLERPARQPPPRRVDGLEERHLRLLEPARYPEPVGSCQQRFW